MRDRPRSRRLRADVSLDLAIVASFLGMSTAQLDRKPSVRLGGHLFSLSTERDSVVRRSHAATSSSSAESEHFPLCAGEQDAYAFVRTIA